MKTKNIIRTFLVALLIVPIFVILTSCGGSTLDSDTKVDVGNADSYAECTSAEYTTAVKDADVNSFITNGYKATMAISMGEGMEFKFNTIVKLKEDNSISDFAGKITMKGENAEGKADVTGEMYYKDEYMYVNVKGNITAKGIETKMDVKKKVKVDPKDLEGSIDDSADVDSSLAMLNGAKIDIAELLNNISSFVSISKVKKSGDENNFKFQIEMKDDTFGTSSYYIVFTNKKLSGIVTESSFGTGANAFSTKITIAPCSDSVSLPNDLDSYEEVAA